MTSCCKIYGDCQQSDTCPHRTGVVLPHQCAHANRVARIKSSQPKFGDVVPREAGNFKIVDLGPDDDTEASHYADNMRLVRTLLSWLLGVLALVGAVALAVSYSTEAHASALWALLQGVA